MATFEALFSDGVRATFEADTMVVEEGVIVLMREGGGGRTTLAAIGSDELLFIYDTSMPVEISVEDEDGEDYEEEEDD
jgi:hypothetical protein